MNLAAILAILGLACYGALFYIVVSSPLHTRGQVRQLFLSSLIVMVAWQVSALMVALTRRPAVAMAGYQAMTAIVVAFGFSYALFVRSFLNMGNDRLVVFCGSLLTVLASALVVAARPSIIESVYWNTQARFYFPTFGPLAAVVGVPYYTMLAYVVYLLLRGYRRAQQPIARSRIQYILLGWWIVLLGTLANFVPSIKNYPVDLMANVVNAILIAYAIFRYQLLDIRLVIRKGLVYAVPTAVIAIVYFLVVYSIEKLLAFAGYQVFLLSLLAAAVTAVAVQPLRDRAQLLVDQLFFREKYDAQLMLRELSEFAASTLDIERLTRMLLDRLTATIHIKQAWILLKEEEGGQFRLIALTGEQMAGPEVAFSGDHPIVHWLSARKEALSPYEIDVAPQFRALWGTERAKLGASGAQLFVPLLARGELIGILVLGPKLSETPYSQDEQLTLSTLANQVAIAVENARLFADAQEKIAERSRAEAALRASEERYRGLFDESPVALWEEDFSAAKTCIDNLRATGIEDLRQYFADHPEMVPHCAALVKVVHVNRATLAMYEAESIDSFREGLNSVLGAHSWDVFLEGLLALTDGATRFESEALNRTLKDKMRHIDLRWLVAAGHEETLSVVLVSTMDITERKQRETMLRRRTARLELLREIDEAILEARPSDKTIELALQRVRSLLDCDGAGLVTMAVEMPSVPAGESDPDQKPEAYRLRDQEVLRLLQDGKTYVLDDLAAVAYPLPVIQNLQAVGHRSALFVPVLQRQPKLVDTLVLTSSRPGAFGDEEQDVGKELAHSLALAIRNTELRREIRERTQALEQQLARVNLFNEITRAVAARHDLESILAVVAQRLEDDFTDQASIWLRHGDGFTLAANGEHSRQSQLETGIASAIPIPPEIPEYQMVLQGRIAYIADLALLGLQHVSDVVQDLYVRSAVIAPLVVEDEVFGIIVSARRARDGFSRAERDFLSELGEHVALAVHQARLHRDLEAAYNELRETQRAVMQQERLRALGEMASGIAHDINNAISPIPLYAGLIESKPGLDDESRAYMRTIKTAVKDVEETVGRMRQFYRRREHEALSPVAVNLAVQQAIELTRPRWRDVPQEHGITIALRTDFQAGLPSVMGNEGEIRQAVTNLILNAVDAMPEGGTLTLRTRDTPVPSAHVILEVIDTGTGMDEEVQARAFEPFFSTKGERGSGMGLSSVYGTMQRHGGDVQLETALGEGTTMRLIFPMRSVAADDAREESPAPPLPLRILCVDDEPLLREALKEALEGEGHTVALADGGESGLETFRAALQRGEPFQVVITDLGMPHVDGRRVARTVKAEAPETPVILLTGWGQRLHAENEMPPDVDLVLSKPPRLETLNHALSQVTSRH